MDKKTTFVSQVKIGFFRKLWNRFWYLIGYMGPGNRLRVFANRRRGVHIGKNVFIDAMVHIDTAVPHLVTIEDDVKLSVGVKIFAHNSVFQDINSKDQIVLSPVLIKKKAQLAPNVVVLDGVTVGESSIVGACALVNKDIPDKTIAVGIPAKPIKNYEEARKAFLEMVKEQDKKST